MLSAPRHAGWSRVRICRYLDGRQARVLSNSGTVPAFMRAPPRARSMSVILFNKWILAYSGFPFPLALTLWHMFFCSTIAFFLVRILKVVKPVNMPRRDYLRKVMPIGARAIPALFIRGPNFKICTTKPLPRRPAVCCVVVALQQRVSVPLRVLHPDDQGSHAWPGEPPAPAGLPILSSGTLIPPRRASRRCTRRGCS